MAVYVLIMVGGVVRATGAGMGCPDWPKCFGSWAPPSSVEQLPENYKATYAAIREKKNQKFARYLRSFGFAATADQILQDKSIQDETGFNVTKAWIEYGNRLVGVVIGFMILALAIQSRIFLKKSAPPSGPVVFILSAATLLAVIAQGWFGSIVVSTNLLTWTITVHMFLALLIVALLIRILSLVTEKGLAIPNPLGLRRLLAACMITLLIQIFLGTQVRSGIDGMSGSTSRSGWIEGLGVAFLIHRSFSFVVVILHVILLTKLTKIDGPKTLPRALLVIILGAFLTGVGMAWWAVPAVLQPLHLVLATSAFGIQLFLFFLWSPHRIPNPMI